MAIQAETTSREGATTSAFSQFVTPEIALELITALAAIAIIAVFVIVAILYRRAIWRWVWMAEEGRQAGREDSSSAGGNTTGGTTAAAPTTAPLAYRLLVIAISSVTVLFVITMLLFWAARNVNGNVLFDDPAQVTAALTSAFAVIGTLVGTYFGVKTSSDAQASASNLAQSAAQTAADTADKAANRAADALRESQSSSGAVGRDTLLMISALHSAWNAGTPENQEKVVGVFADSAVVSLVAADGPKSYEGKERIRGFVQDYMPGCQVDSRNYQLVGNVVAWESTVIWNLADASAKVKEKSVSQVDGTVIAAFEGNRIKSLTFSLSAAAQ